MDRWKDVDEERPEIGTKCVVVDINGRMSIETYCHYNVVSVSRAGATRVHLTDDENAPQGFVSSNEMLDRTAVYYTELPKTPSKLDRARQIKEKIEKLQKELKTL